MLTRLNFWFIHSYFIFTSLFTFPAKANFKCNYFKILNFLKPFDLFTFNSYFYNIKCAIFAPIKSRNFQSHPTSNPSCKMEIRNLYTFVFCSFLLSCTFIFNFISINQYNRLILMLLWISNVWIIIWCFIQTWVCMKHEVVSLSSITFSTEPFSSTPRCILTFLPYVFPIELYIYMAYMRFSHLVLLPLNIPNMCTWMRSGIKGEKNEFVCVCLWSFTYILLGG